MSAAGFWRRVGAALVDRLVGIVAWSLGAMWIALALWALRGLPRDLVGLLLLDGALIALALALHVAYHVALVGGCGQTLGAMATGIAVVRSGGAPAGYARAVVRCAAGILNALLLGLPSLLLLLLVDRSRGFGDWLGGTRVIRLPAPRP